MGAEEVDDPGKVLGNFPSVGTLYELVFVAPREAPEAAWFKSVDAVGALSAGGGVTPATASPCLARSSRRYCGLFGGCVF